MRISRIRQKSFAVVREYLRRKYLIVFGNGAQRLQAYTAILEWFYSYKVVSEYAKTILTCTENTLKAFKSIRRIRQKYFAVCWEYADRHKTELISANFRPKPKKFQILNHHSIHDRIGKKPISRYCPFTWVLSVSWAQAELWQRQAEFALGLGWALR
jgi:hypothetical protein